MRTSSNERAIPHERLYHDSTSVRTHHDSTSVRLHHDSTSVRLHHASTSVRLHHTSTLVRLHHTLTLVRLHHASALVRLHHASTSVRLYITQLNRNCSTVHITKLSLYFVSISLKKLEHTVTSTSLVLRGWMAVVL